MNKPSGWLFRFHEKSRVVPSASRPEYKTFERVSISDLRFEVYKAAQGVFAIYEPHQAEETISYLLVAEKRALLFDTGMRSSDFKKVREAIYRK